MTRLKGWNVLQPKTKVCYFRNRDEELKGFFLQDNQLVFSNIIYGVMTVLSKEYKTEEWRLFIDGSKVSLTAVLLHIGDKLSSISLGEPSYETIKFMF